MLRRVSNARSSTVLAIPAGLFKLRRQRRFTAGDAYDDNAGHGPLGGTATLRPLRITLIQRARLR